MTALRRTIGAVAHVLIHAAPAWAVALLAYGLIAYGAWLAWHPLGFVIGGVLLIPLDQTVQNVWAASRPNTRE